MVTMVLLNEAFTWATPEVMFLRSRRLTRPGSLAIGQASLLLLLAGDRLGRTLAGASVGVSALAADRQALTVTQAAIAGQVHQTLDVHRRLATQVAFDSVVAVDGFADLQDLRVGQLVHAASRLDADLGRDLLGVRRANAVDVLKRDFNALVGRNVDACDTGHEILQVRVNQTQKPLRSTDQERVRPSRKSALIQGIPDASTGKRREQDGSGPFDPHPDLSTINRRSVLRRRTKAEISGGRKGRLAESHPRRRFVHQTAVAQSGVQTNPAGQRRPPSPALAEGFARVQAPQFAHRRAANDARRALTLALADAGTAAAAAARPLPALSLTRCRAGLGRRADDQRLFGSGTRGRDDFGRRRRRTRSRGTHA